MKDYLSYFYGMVNWVGLEYASVLLRLIDANAETTIREYARQKGIDHDK